MRGSDPRQMKNFYLYCLRHGSKFRSIGEIADHRKRNGEGRTGLNILCGCCGDVFSVWEKLTVHTNVEAFHLRMSTIPGYNKATFSARTFVADRRDRQAILDAAAEARSAAAAREAEAATAVSNLPSRSVWDSGIMDVSPPSFSEIVAAAVDPLFQTLGASSPNVLTTPVISTPESPAGFTSEIPCVTSSTRGTTSTVTVPSSSQLRSVFLLQTSVTTPVAQQAPASTLTLPPVGATEDLGALRDPFVGFPSNPVASVTGDGVANPPAANVTPQPEVTSGPAAYGQPLPLYSSFASLFPARFFGSTGDMPSSLLVHSLVQTVVWTTTMLRGMLRGTPLPPNLTPVDESGRLAIMPTPFWPGGNHSLSSPLEELLGDMLPLYMELLNHGPYTY